MDHVQRPSAHLGYVQTIATGGYFAVCPSCGVLLTPDRATREEAHQDVAHHVENVTAAYIRATQHLFDRPRT
jgi:hypothetical protein